MSTVLPALLAILLGGALAFFLLTPFVYRSYRRRGELGFWSTLLAFGSLLYGLALVAYVLFPIPTIDAAWCSAHTALSHPQLNPMQFLDDISQNSGPGGLLANRAIQQLVFNVFLFIPLGAYLRHYTRRGPMTIVAIGLGVSLLIELTQLTGNWFLFECPYRLFDVDDLLTNTTGTAIGLLFAPLLGLLDHRRKGVTSETPRPVTVGRRLLGMLVDFVSVTAFGGTLAILTNLIISAFSGSWPGDSAGGRLLNLTLTTFLPVVLLLALPALGPRHATIGQLAVRLRRVRPDGGPMRGRMVVALLSGTFGYYVLYGLSHYVPAFQGLAQLLPFAAFVFVVFRKDRAGFSGLLSGLRVEDDRLPVHRVERARQS
ncbi:VanZ family protein [Kribbella sp. NBC_01505]|uniref:VanZ family protein n=1 Tax=Kribbella sp. NBC_01505 TaxID=2903580 RepID=UPI0038662852